LLFQKLLIKIAMYAEPMVIAYRRQRWIAVQFGAIAFMEISAEGVACFIKIAGEEDKV
jgi:hypothetical protein